MLAANVIYEMLALIARNRKDTSRR
jgi:hypothetical protein